MYGKQKGKRDPCRYSSVSRVRAHLKGGRIPLLRQAKITKIQQFSLKISKKKSTKSSKKWLKWPLNDNQMIKKHIIMMFKCYCEVFCLVLIPYCTISGPSIPGHRNRPIPGRRIWKLIRNKWNRLGAVWGGCYVRKLTLWGARGDPSKTFRESQKMILTTF